MASTFNNSRLRRVIVPVLGVLVVFVASLAVRDCVGKQEPPPAAANCQRIIALSPSAVEIIYRLGLGDRLVGVSRFCEYPPEAADKPVVGGYIDLDFEAVLRLEPDCVVLLEEQREVAAKLRQLGVRTIAVDHASTGGILASISEIGAASGKAGEAAALVGSLRQRIREVVKKSAAAESRPRVLVCISRDTGSDQPDRIIAAGNAGVHQEYITMAGGENAYRGAVAYPSISRENLIRMDPDVIIDLLTEEAWNKVGREKLLGQWSAYPELRAVKNRRIVILHKNKYLIPGPRFVDTVEAFARAIHPETP